MRVLCGGILRGGEFYDEDAGSECNHSLGELIEVQGG